MYDPCGDGFRMTVFPAASAAPAGPAARAIGKLNGLITAHTPYGRSTLTFPSRGFSAHGRVNLSPSSTRWQQ